MKGDRRVNRSRVRSGAPWSRLLAVMVAALLLTSGGAQQPRVEIQFWFAFTGPLGKAVEEIVGGFNAAQNQYRVNAIYKGGYTDTMMAAIAAFRAGTAPHIVQVFEVGTATMMAAGPAIKPVYELFAETGVPFDPSVYIPAVAGYYSLLDGRMISMPFNSSTAVTWYNKDAFRKAGLDPENPPKTWPEVRAAAKRIVDTGAAKCGFSFAWPTWTQYEQFSAIHNVPLATKANGMLGMDAELAINSPLHVRHLQMLVEMLAERSFTYGGRDSAGDALFRSGECAILQGSSGLRAGVVREAKFDWGVTFLPYYPDVAGAPLNSIIGGASFWAMTAPGRAAAEYRGVAEFFRYIGRAEVAEKWHVGTGFLPVVRGVYERLEATGFYRQNPGLDLPYLQLTRSQPTENSRGIRLGNLPEIRNIIQEEVELAFQLKQTPQRALDNAVRRGNTVLRAFERANR